VVTWAAMLLLLCLVGYMFIEAPGQAQTIPYSEFLDRVEGNEVAEVEIRGYELSGRLKAPDGQGRRFKSHAPPDVEGLVKSLREHGVEIKADEPRGSGFMSQMLVLVLPLLALVALWLFFMRQMQGTGAKAMSFGKSRARLLSSSQKKVTFKDVAGCEEAKDELQEIVEFLKDPQKFARLGGRIPKGVLLIGQPGTGKTLLARAIAGEANVPFFSLSGSDFVEMFVGVGASRVRDLFEQGKKNAPCIIFIDEIDAVGRHRGAGLGGGHDEREQTLNALLVEMDGFEATEGVIIIAATNRPDVLDPALLRPGRFDRRVVVNLPDVRGREAILRVHVRKVPLASSIDLSVLARSTPGFSGADLANLVNEAALAAARANAKAVTQRDLEVARDKVVLGAARRSMIISEREKRVTAYHEAGHALTAELIEGATPVHKVTIIPHAMALGVTQFLPEDDRYTRSEKELRAQLAVGLGGRAAEQLVFGELTTGAADDIKKATDMARRMVAQWGMSETIGPVGFAEREDNVFLGRELGRAADYSEATAQEIDRETKRLVDEAWQTSLGLLTENRETLERVALALLDRETIDARDFAKLLAGEALDPVPHAGEDDGSGVPISSGTEGTGDAIPAEGAVEAATDRAKAPKPYLQPLQEPRTADPEA